MTPEDQEILRQDVELAAALAESTAGIVGPDGETLVPATFPYAYRTAFEINELRRNLGELGNDLQELREYLHGAREEISAERGRLDRIEHAVDVMRERFGKLLEEKEAGTDQVGDRYGYSAVELAISQLERLSRIGRSS